MAPRDDDDDAAAAAAAGDDGEEGDERRAEAEAEPNDFELEAAVRLNAAGFGTMVAAGGMLEAAAGLGPRAVARLAGAAYAKGTPFPTWAAAAFHPSGPPPERIAPDGRVGPGGARAGEALFREAPAVAMRGLGILHAGGGLEAAPREPAAIAALLLTDRLEAGLLLRVLPPPHPGAAADAAARHADLAGCARASTLRPAAHRALFSALYARLVAARVEGAEEAPDEYIGYAIAPRLLAAAAAAPPGAERNARLALRPDKTIEIVAARDLEAGAPLLGELLPPSDALPPIGALRIEGGAGGP